MPAIYEGRRPAEFVMSEANGRLSRDVVTVASGADIDPNTVVGRVTATGKVKALDPAASDGTQNAYGILLYPAKAADAEVEVTAIVRHAEVNGLTIVWPAGITAEQKTAAVAALAARSVIVR